jgi:hypothetical protein
MTTAARSLRESSFQGWPAYALQQDDLVLQVVPSVGGRLMGLAFAGQELCFTHPDLRGKNFDGELHQWDALCAGWSFPLWGGGKTWIAPESAWPGGAPHRDLDSLAWTLLEHWCDAQSMGIELQSPICTVTGLQLRRRLVLPCDAQTWSIEHTVHNTGTQPISCGLWDVLMLQRPGDVQVMLAAKGRYPGERVVALPGKKACAQLEAQGTLHTDGDVAYIHCHSGDEFKCGFTSLDGRVQVDFAQWGLRYQRHSVTNPQSTYAHGLPVEVFNAPALDYFELETHSPLHMLQAGQTASYTIYESVTEV